MKSPCGLTQPFHIQVDTTGYRWVAKSLLDNGYRLNLWEMPLLWGSQSMPPNSERDLTSLCHRFAIVKATQNDTTRKEKAYIYARFTLKSSEN